MGNNTSSWWPCSLPPLPLWLHLNCISRQICLLPVKDRLLCLQPQETILLILFSPHLSYPSPSSLTAVDFATYFTKKGKDISSSFTSMPIQKAPSPILTSDGLTCFSPLSSEDALTPVMPNQATTCSLNPIPSSLLQNFSHDILPFLTSLINSCLTSGLQLLNTATVKSLEKPTLDSADIWNYRPVSLLSFLSKTMEYTVYNQLSSCLLKNHLLDPEPRPTCQSPFSSTSLLCLTVNHQILLSTLTEHCWLCSNLVHIIPDKSHLSGHLERLLVQTLLSGNWCPSRLSIRTGSVFTAH